MTAQLARICRAIEELAGLPGVPDDLGEDGQDGTDADKRGGTAAAGGVAPEDAQAARLAEIWAMLAEADPELAKRVPGYLAATD